ncbi:hypothetical protein [Motilibacter deserti]|uniref:Uncharacterized protein n=1 Tax=Motilibacter deserti TaxID=2714956 RepID=A0ABX0GRZ4_9ACTN|nr:hypothetical protein [Motilibacter deserti]NHC13646.1 hypothetical protein [Motilibacter deserti]
MIRLPSALLGAPSPAVDRPPLWAGLGLPTGHDAPAAAYPSISDLPAWRWC